MSNWRAGVAPYIWHQRMKIMENLPRLCEDVKAAGFEGVEFFGGWATDPHGKAEIERGLKATGLTFVALYVGGDFYLTGRRDQAVAEGVEAAKCLAAFGANLLLVGPNPVRQNRAKTDAEIKVEVPAIAELAERIAPLGVQIALHNHIPEVLNDAAELEAILAATPAAQVGLNVDTEWCVQASVDPIAFLKRFAPRVKHMHIRNSENKVWTEHLGEGDIDQPAIAQALREIGYSGWLMLEDAWDGQRDLKLTHVERATKGREAMRKWFGV